MNSSTEIWCKSKLKEWKNTRIITINEENVAKQTRKITIDSPTKFGLLTFEKRRTDQKIFIDDKNELILRYSEDQYGGTWIISELGRNENEMICGIQSHQKDNFFDLMSEIWCLSKQTNKWEKIDIQEKIPTTCEQSISINSPTGYLTMKKIDNLTFIDEKSAYVLFFSEKYSSWIIANDKEDAKTYICYANISSSKQEKKLQEVFDNLICLIDGKPTPWKRHEFKENKC